VAALKDPDSCTVAQDNVMANIPELAICMHSKVRRI
jgi:hypothetical protein